MPQWDNPMMVYPVNIFSRLGMKLFCISILCANETFLGDLVGSYCGSYARKLSVRFQQSLEQDRLIQAQ